MSDMLRAALIGFSLIVLALLVITVPQPTFDPSRTMGVYMAESYDTDANYVIKLTDPADPNKVVGYAFVEQVHYLAADDDSDDAKAAIAGVAGLFTDGPVLDAVALPGQQRATRAYFAEIGSGKADFA